MFRSFVDSVAKIKRSITIGWIILVTVLLTQSLLNCLLVYVILDYITTT